MSFERGIIYESFEDFFNHGGNGTMMLSPSAAIAVCEQALNHNLLVGKIEGGIWRFPGFEARLDCIWDGPEPPVSKADALEINKRAADFIREESAVHDVFIVTALRNREKYFPPY